MKSNSPQNIVLIGFMAAGKSRVGKILAKRLKFSLFDIDKIIEETEGRPIHQIFSEQGEGYFRAQEAKALESLKDKTRAIIVTGGGAPMFFNNAKILKKLGAIFFLDASLALIVKRLRQSIKRPLGLINTQEDYQAIRDLYLYRRPVYANLGETIDVDDEDSDETCDEIVARFNAFTHTAIVSKTVVEDKAGAYPIFHESNARHSLKNIIVSLGLKNYRPVIVTSDSLNTALGDVIVDIRENLHVNVPVITIKDGEQHKNLDAINAIHHKLFSLGYTRQSLVIALGGGNVGDVAGFASAIYLRRVPFIQIPTTLLAMVDASIGGKTGIDTAFGKNLVGAFYSPKAVIIDPDLLATLPKDELACGMAEVIKHAIIGDKDLFFLLQEKKLDPSFLIERALKVKADIVFNDPHEHNIRAHLNLGHTFAHAIEKVSHFEIKHGKAVAIGLVLACKLARHLEVLQENFLPELIVLLEKYDLPVSLPQHIRIADLVPAMKHDKKRDAQGLKFVLPRRLSEVCLQYVDDDVLIAALS